MRTTTQIIPGWRGVDYAFARPDPPTMKAAGITFVCRYLSKVRGDGTWNPKDVKPAEIAALHAAGIAVILNWEQSSGDALGGASVGSMHGIAALERVRRLGYPESLAIVKSCDTGVSGSQLATVEAHLRAFAAAIAPYRLGVYGGTTVIDLVADICVLGWQANARSWSPRPSSNVHVRQHTQAADHQTDPNECVRQFAAWLPSDDPPPPAEVQAPPATPAAPPAATQPPPPIFPPSLRALLEEDTVQYIADSDHHGSALITFVTTADNAASYRMAGIDEDTRNMFIIDAGIPAVHWPDDIYMLRAARSYRG